MKKYKGIILIAISAIVYGMMPAFAKIAYKGGSNPIELNFLRFVIGSIALFVAMAIKGESLSLIKYRHFKIMRISVWFALTPIILFTSYNYISSGMATTLHYVYPIIVIFLCSLIFKVKITVFQLISAALCLIGVFSFSSNESGFNFIGAATAIGSGLTYAIYVISFSRFNTEGISAFKFSFYLYIYSAIITLIPGLFLGSMKFDIDIIAWISIIVLSISTSIISTVFFQEGVRLIGPQKASLISTFEPVMSVIIGFILFNEALKLKSIFGIILILISVIILSLEKQSEEESFSQ
ncbi:MAG: EamA family transporter [Tissierellia bacterium]|nr:EamA family transporter [Tissierellia bacterium]